MMTAHVAETFFLTSTDAYVTKPRPPNAGLNGASRKLINSRGEAGERQIHHRGEAASLMHIAGAGRFLLTRVAFVVVG